MYRYDDLDQRMLDDRVRQFRGQTERYLRGEIINKVGSLMGGLTYGAKKETAEKHFRAALELNPDSAIARTEYADGLVMMFGNSRLQEAEKYYAEAVKCTPADAMERLDIEAAKAEMDE